MWKSQIPQSHTADKPTALYGRAKYHNRTLQTNPGHCVEEPNTTITQCRPTHGTVWKSQIPQSHTADQPTALCGRAKYHNHTLQTNPGHCVEEPNTTYIHCRPTNGTVWKSQIPQSHTVDQPTAQCGRAKYHNHELQTNPRHCMEEPNTTIKHCRPTHAPYGRAKYHNHTAHQPTALYGRAKYHNHTAHQPTALYGRAKYHNHTLQTNPRHCMEEPNTTITLQTNPRHCMEEPNTTITHCRPTHGTVWKSQIPQSHCRPTHDTVWKSQIPQSHTVDQPTALYGRAKYHNHTADQPTALYGRAKYHNHTADEPTVLYWRATEYSPNTHT